jgi:hypothetical protein
VVLDLYARRFEGELLYPGDFVICADEKSQLQALGRRHATVPAAPGRPALVEFEYRRGGTPAYLAAWDVHHARLFDRVKAKTGIELFGRLVEQVMSTEPYRSARQVFWIVDNGGSHAGRASVERMGAAWRNPRPTHLPIHASWLNRIELFFSIVQRKALTPNNFGSLDELAERLLAFGEHHRAVARRFHRTFTRADLDALLARPAGREPQLRLAAQCRAQRSTRPAGCPPASAPPPPARRPPGSHSRTAAVASHWPDQPTPPPPAGAPSCPRRAQRSPPVQAARAQAACRARREPR